MLGSGIAAWIAVRLSQVRGEQQLISVSAKLSEIQAKLDTHIQADATAHERIRGAEVLLEQTDRRLTDVDGRRHRYQTFNDEAMRDMQRWITERVIEALKR